jgi:hypothetical protein
MKGFANLIFSANYKNRAFCLLFMEQHEISDKISAGATQCRITLEIMGHPKEHVEKTIKLVVERLKAEKGIDVISSRIHEVKLQEEQKLFSTYADIELLFADFEALTRTCFDYMPSSLEILEPSDFQFSALDLSNFVSDTLSTLHHIDFQLKDSNARNRLLERNSANLLKNFVLLALESGKKSSKQISDIIGIKPEQLAPFLDAFTQEKMIAKNGDLWEKL